MPTALGKLEQQLYFILPWCGLDAATGTGHPPRTHACMLPHDLLVSLMPCSIHLSPLVSLMSFLQNALAAAFAQCSILRYGKLMSTYILPSDVLGFFNILGSVHVRCYGIANILY